MERLLCFVPNNYFDRQDADRKRIRFAEFLLAAFGLAVGVDGDRQAIVRVVG